ncbi:NFX1-type zinc finger-containing protein 1-like [Arctopsyche grandis]|uniref:NFX1-type zinc finger-containing protein 1-like n=1 Tax=Arctopsyche grandis TaxID=121162 RepID=UPI00406D7944
MDSRRASFSWWDFYEDDQGSPNTQKLFLRANSSHGKERPSLHPARPNPEWRINYGEPNYDLYIGSSSVGKPSAKKDSFGRDLHAPSSGLRVNYGGSNSRLNNLPISSVGKRTWSNHRPSPTGISKEPAHASSNSRRFQFQPTNQPEHKINKHANPIDMSHITFGFKQLLEMSSQDGSEILMVFSRQNKKFTNTLTKDFSPDNIVLFMNCLSKVCIVNFNESKANIMTKVCQSNFLESFEKYILNLPYVKMNEKKMNKLFWDDYNGFWKNVFTFYNCVITLMPNIALDTLTKLVDYSKVILQGLQDRQKLRFEDGLQQSLTDIQTRMTLTKEELSERFRSRKALDDDREVPDDFRTMPILPDADEINSNNFTFLRPNIIDGAYNCVDHYLDVQFRLMREDYISPMRDAIMSFLHDPKQKKHNGGRFYLSARFKYFAVSNKRAGILVAFDENNLNRHPKAFYKRFLFGSLLCFTKDKFKTCLFGTIVERSEQLLSQGMVIVDMKNEDIGDDLFNGTYVMFESDVFFLQYGPVLEALQNSGENLPMKDYIVNMQVSTVVPKHITNIYNISFNDKTFKVDIKNNLGWPSSSDLGLDEYQYAAYKMALSREFVTIQGPPGTGKTYIGLKIVNTLLKNVSVSDKPLLVLCFTNHALDQFLSGILPTTKNIVRIGGQSKNDEFAKNYNLNSLRKLHNSKNPHSRDLFDLIKKMNQLQNSILHIEAADGIIDVDLLNDRLPQFQICGYLWNYSSNSSKSRLVNWLLMSDKLQEVEKYRHEDIYQCYLDILAVERFTKDDLDIDDMRNVLDDDDDFEISPTPVTYKKFSLFSFADEISQTSEKIELKAVKTHRTRDETYHLCQLFLLKTQLSCASKETVNFSNLKPKDLNLNQRWNLYWYWCSELKNVFFNETMKLREKYQTLYALYEDFNTMSDIQILKKAHVIGLTTTAAARLRPLLCSLSPSIVVIEEAAEVLESHIVVNLNENCKHVIMLGDHQQLRPTTASYQLGRKFHLEISLFERTFKNGTNFCQLGVQHRMRPEIASLITPAIYPKLENHSSVYDYPNVLGVAKNLFFVAHEFPEAKEAEISSHSNAHEAQFIVLLANYLIQQGYNGEDITILSAYSGQMFYLKELKKKMDAIKDVRICILDNYQGEECKIILLTLVRSNTDNKVGFLNIPNRVCVALSRAKEGFYLIGNMNNLINASELWKKICRKLIQHESIGPSIPLQCQNHNFITKVESLADFSKVVEGGCQNQCNKLLKCGHHCPRLCHLNLNEHDDYKCTQNCLRDCSVGHKCKLLCCQPCKCSEIVDKLFGCGHMNKIMCSVNPNHVQCRIEVLHTFPQCLHEVKLLCYNARDKPQCPIKCIDRLPCGHACTELCHKDDDPEHLEYECKASCGRKNKSCVGDHSCKRLCYQECDLCTILVQKKRKDCSHSDKVQCNMDVNSVRCEKNCVRKMRCGHFCKKKCFEPCTDCGVMVKKQRSCGHIITTECSTNVEQIKCTQRCKLRLECGHRCRDECMEPCNVKSCNEKITNPFKSICGHIFQIPCCDSDLAHNGGLLTMEYCTQPCGTILKDCEHICQGTCGKCRGRLHPPCSQPCGNRLICGDTCDDPCREDCSMCRKPCKVKCNHSKCPFTCGVPCKPCKHKCDRRCSHSECTKQCGEICDRIPCSEPCSLKLKCGHGCLGLCGEVCPDICRICKPDCMPEIFFGNEEDEDAKFIKLIDCKHIIEVEGMDNWIKSLEEGEIAYPRCPHCSTAVMNTPRYSNAIKMTFDNIQNVKRKIYGNPVENKALIKKLDLEIDKLTTTRMTDLFRIVPQWKTAVEKIKNEPLFINAKKDKHNTEKWTKKTVQLCKPDLDNLIVQTTVLNRLANVFLGEDYSIRSKLLKYQVQFILSVLCDCKIKVTQQQINDFDSEIARTQNMIRYEVAKKKMDAVSYINSKDKNTVSNLSSIIYFNNSFNAQVEENVKALFRSLTFGVDISDSERSMIVKAMGLKKGHWFKCPNGHPYCITECGGAMQKSLCPECGSGIGGTNHALLSTNSLAAEMDNATHAAYSDIANEGMMINLNLHNYL